MERNEIIPPLKNKTHEAIAQDIAKVLYDSGLSRELINILVMEFNKLIKSTSLNKLSSIRDMIKIKIELTRDIEDNYTGNAHRYIERITHCHKKIFSNRG